MMNEDMFDLIDDRAWRHGKAKPGRKPKRGPRTRGENFQHWRMRHGVSAGDMAKAGSTHDELAMMFSFERGTASLVSRQLIALAHAVLITRDKFRARPARTEVAA